MIEDKNSIYLDCMEAFEFIHMSFFDFLREELEENNLYGINSTTIKVVYKLGKINDKVSLRDFLAKTPIPSAKNLSYALTKLSEDGYVDSTDHPTDKRLRMLSLSPKGAKLFKKINAIISGHCPPLTELEAFHTQILDLKSFYDERK